MSALFIFTHEDVKNFSKKEVGFFFQQADRYEKETLLCKKKSTGYNVWFISICKTLMKKKKKIIRYKQVSSPLRWDTVICSPNACLPWHHDARNGSVTVRNMFILCKQLSIHQRQRHSVALVTAYGPTPSYDMMKQDLIGQMCVIIDGMWAHWGAFDKVSPLRITSIGW